MKTSEVTNLVSRAYRAARTVCVSVIIPTYNRQAFIVKAVNSVLNQTFRNFEIIVVDDGSIDDTRSTLQPYADKIKYVYQNNSGVSAARNRGISIATGEWVAFLDSDDEWDSDFLGRHMQAISQNPDVCVQIADCRYVDQTGAKKSYYAYGSAFEWTGVIKRFGGTSYLRPREPFAFMLRHLNWMVQSGIYRREIIEKSGFFDVNFKFGEDSDFVVRAALHGPVGLLKDALLTLYRRPETTENLSKIAMVDPLNFMLANDVIFQKWESIPFLSGKNLRRVKWLRSGNYRSIGNLLRAGGKVKEARGAYWTAIKIQPSARSIGKYVLSFMYQR